uniref:Uncharacterized protein n=1 Tax=Trichogramma kaykai TaxID=54128 RepID=A0ABD2X5B8_9HYME
MSTLATFFAIIAALQGIILLGSVSPASAYRSFSFKGDIGENFLVFSESAIKNTTVYYGICGRAVEQTEKECIVRRVQADFSGGSPKEDECNVMLRSESGSFIAMDLIRIDPLGKDRAIVHWLEDTERYWYEKYHLRFSIVDFSNCKVKTTKISKDLDQLVQYVYYPRNGQFAAGFLGNSFDEPRYLKREDDFDVLFIVESSDHNSSSIYSATIDNEGTVSKVNTLLTSSGKAKIITPLKEGYLLIEEPFRSWPEKSAITVAHIQPNGQRQNLTHIEDVQSPLLSMTNELIGICARRNETIMKCTQFKLGDKEIHWFSAEVFRPARYGSKQAIYNMPGVEGFMTYLVNNEGDSHSTDMYLIKIGLDGKAKQFLNPDMKCKSIPKEAGFTRLTEDRGSYCLTTACVRVSYDNYDFEPSYVRLKSRCFNPKEYKNISKYELVGEQYSKTLLIE